MPERRPCLQRKENNLHSDIYSEQGKKETRLKRTATRGNYHTMISPSGSLEENEEASVEELKRVAD